MGSINVLDFHVANLIAAGEVVDRPASVVKELLENAIDAGAQNVTVEIKRGGVSFIRVTDDGCGMAREDVPIALKRHATSKIREAADLDGIATLGFRGEALAAISAVSKLRIMTKRREDPRGTLLEAHGGKVLSVNDAGCPDGTTMIIEDLFYNTPARLKFLKKDGTEAGNVAAYVEKIALSHPEIALRFLSDGELKYATAGDGNLAAVIYAVLGREFARKTLEVRGGFDGVEVTGYIGAPETARGNRNLQIFFINERYIRSKTVSAALEQAFATFIPADKFPCAVLYLSMNAGLVDVNVHPAKLEVKFSNERLIFESVYYAVRGVLENKLSRPEISLLRENEKKQAERLSVEGFAPVSEGRGGEKKERIADLRQTVAEGVSGKKDMALPENPRLQESAFSVPKVKTVLSEPEKPKEPTHPAAEEIPLPEPPPEDPGISYDYVIPPLPKQEAKKTPSVTEEPSKLPEKSGEAEAPGEVPEYRMVGEVFHCYVILEVGDTMYMIDKHAAHERILFEEFKKNARANESLLQMLLLPITLTLSQEEALAAAEFEKELTESGFSYTVNGKEADIYGIPAFLDSGAASDAFCEAVARLADHTGTAALTRDIRFERALFQASCKAAIKAGRDYDDALLHWICDRVLSDPKIRVCPHGRPVCYELKKSTIENQFGRT